MGATTNYGLPYPELGDASNVPGDVRALAEATDDVIPELRAGTATVASGAADTTLFFDVVFASSMSTTPKVTITLATTYAAASATPIAYWISNISATGFRINTRRTGATMFATDWNYIALVA